MAPRKKINDEEKKRKKKEYDRLRKEKIKTDPQLLAKQKFYEQLKYRMKLQKKQIKPVKDMTCCELRDCRRKGRVAFKKWYWKKKEKILQEEAAEPNVQSEHENSANTSQQLSSSKKRHLLALAEKRKKACKDDLKNRIRKLEEENKKMARIIERLKKRETRAKHAAKSPQSKVKSIMKNETPKQIARRVLFAESVRESVKGYYSTLKKKVKLSFRERFLNNTKFLRKYRLLNKFNFLSARLFKGKMLHVTNSGLARIRLKKITEDVKNDVIRFYEDDDNSIMCPGKRDCITRHQVKKQKRYLSAKLLDLHVKFSNTNTYKLSYSTFCKLKPFWVVPQKITARDTCACRICVNVDLMVSGLHKAEVLLVKKKEDVIKNVCCDKNSLACLQRNCSDCKDLLIPYQSFEDGQLSYDQWTTISADILTKGRVKKTIKHVVKETIKSTVLETVDLFERMMTDFMQHLAIWIHQSRTFRDLKSRLTDNEVVVHCDFSENYAMKYGREIQSVHFGGSRKQFSLHTVEIYFRKSEHEEVKYQSFCTLSSSTEHGPAAVWAHLKPVFEFIAVNLRKVNTVHFQSDSPATQYRNRTIFHLLSHALHVFIPNLKCSTWNYSAPGHGKGAVDGIGGAMKRLLDETVACGQDIGDFDSFVRTLQEKSRKVLLFVITPDDISGIANIIPKSIPPFKGTMKVYQVVYLPKETQDSKTLKMNRLSCFDCLTCDKFTIGHL